MPLNRKKIWSLLVKQNSKIPFLTSSFFKKCSANNVSYTLDYKFQIMHETANQKSKIPSAKRYEILCKLAVDPHNYFNLAEEEQNDQYIVIELIKSYPYMYSILSDTWHNNKDIAILAIECDPSIIGSIDHKNVEFYEELALIAINVDIMQYNNIARSVRVSNKEIAKYMVDVTDNKKFEKVLNAPYRQIFVTENDCKKVKDCMVR